MHDHEGTSKEQVQAGTVQVQAENLLICQSPNVREEAIQIPHMQADRGFETSQSSKEEASLSKRQRRGWWWGDKKFN